MQDDCENKKDCKKGHNKKDCKKTGKEVHEKAKRKTGSQIRKQIAQDFGKNQKKFIREIIEEYIAGIVQGIAEGEEVCVEGLGIFKANKVYQKSTVTCCPNGRYRGKYTTEACVRVYFRRSPKFGRILRNRWLTDKERGR